VGTSIELAIGGISVDWAKNARGNDHGPLFQEHDRKRVRSDQIDYGYFEREQESPGDMEMAFSRTLRSLLPRLELLGYTLATVRRLYQQRAKEWHDWQMHMHVDEPSSARQAILEPLSFDEFLTFVQAHPVVALDDRYEPEVGMEADRRIRGRFAGSETTSRIPSDPERESNAYSERTYFGVLIDFLHPYAVLRLLAECQPNLELDVVWQYGPLVHAGWAEVDAFSPSARRAQTVLIATEGTSDIHVLTRAIALLRTEVADFFRFIDVSERHPFSGAGGLVKFAEGLAKIDVHNRIVFLFDNDAEGVDAFNAVRRFVLPTNMRALLLPDLEAFRQFPARGPNGVSSTDINGRAAAIECYLDLNMPGRGPAQVVWTNYKKERDVYQGALEFKEIYAKRFLQQSAQTLRDGSYDTTKLDRLIDALIEDCCRLAMTVLAAEE
jgi:HEPN/Toprim N-terminal domain 1